MAKAHVVMKMYFNGNAYVEEVFSSKAKALDYIEYWQGVDVRDGWSLSQEVMYLGGRGDTLVFWQEKGAAENKTGYYIVSKEMK